MMKHGTNYSDRNRIEKLMDAGHSVEVISANVSVRPKAVRAHMKHVMEKRKAAQAAELEDDLDEYKDVDEEDD